MTDDSFSSVIYQLKMCFFPRILYTTVTVLLVTLSVRRGGGGRDIINRVHKIKGEKKIIGAVQCTVGNLIYSVCTPRHTVKKLQFQISTVLYIQPS